MLLHAAIEGNFSAFEFLVEHGATPVDADDDESDVDIDMSVVDTMLNRRQEWIDLVATLVRYNRLPLVAARTVHEYVVGFNWSAVYESIASRPGIRQSSNVLLTKSCPAKI